MPRLLTLLRDHSVGFCVIDGQAVNAYAEPVVSLDFDIIVAVDDFRRLTDPERHASKRQKDLANIARVIEVERASRDYTKRI